MDFMKKAIKRVIKKIKRNNNNDSEKCPMCLAKFKNQNIGCTTECGHCFCAICILKWTDTQDICPLDQITISNIVIYKHYKEKNKASKIPTPRNELEYPISLEDSISTDSLNNSIYIHLFTY